MERALNDRDHAVDMLDPRIIDVAIGVAPTRADSRILSIPVLQHEFVTILPSDHPDAQRAMTLETYLSLAHVLVSPEGECRGLVDEALAQQGKTRQLALTPQMFAVPAVVTRTRITATVMRRVALSSEAGRQLALFPPPLNLPSVVFHLIWHRRSESSLAQARFGDSIAASAATL